jgi:signal transduction histidine kinase
VCLEISDTGIGLSEAEQAQLFTRFFRADNPAVRAVGGTGLGLVITRSLVELHGGDISVRSAPGQGSTFVVTLPADVPEAAGELRTRLAA